MWLVYHSCPSRPDVRMFSLSPVLYVLVIRRARPARTTQTSVRRTKFSAPRPTLGTQRLCRRTACARRARDVHRRAHDVRFSQFGTRFWPTIFIDVVICVVCGSGNQEPINVFTCSLLAVYPYPLGPVMRRARPVRATCTRHAQTCTPSTRR